MSEEPSPCHTTKFIIDRNGNVVARFEPTADMAEVEAAPKIIKEGVSIEEAEALKAKFEELGAAITLK